MTLWTALKVAVINLSEYIQVIFRYYRSLSFAKVDIALLSSYLFSSPFRISKKFLLERGERDVYTYGETPLTTMEKIASECGITAQDVVIELGCGRGRGCFWLGQFIGCTVIGIDYVPAFIDKAAAVKKRFHVQHVYFRLEDIFHADLKGGTVIYLYGTCLLSDQISLLIERLDKLPADVKIITVSYALTEIYPKAPFRIVKQFRAEFTWGKTDVYLQVIEHNKIRRSDSVYSTKKNVVT